MRILFLTYFFEPDLSAGSFRNTSLLKMLDQKVSNDVEIDVITTKPNRYSSYNIEAKKNEKLGYHTNIYRIEIPNYGSGMKNQVRSFFIFYINALKIADRKKYDLVYASSSKLFTAFLGSRLARKNKAKLYLDIRDIFKETIIDVFNNPILKPIFNTVFSLIEKYTFNRANHINLVSKGFKSYFKKFNLSTYSYFTNGIDDLFLENSLNAINSNIMEKDKRIILYAGNIGEGQGLEKIIPELADKLPDKYVIEIIGDGNAKEKLIKEIKTNNILNVNYHPPMNRNELLKFYNKTDYFFLHLNDLKAFERVLPSKIFEYAVFGKPIIAGVNGYASTFIKNNLKNSIIFKSGDVDELLNKLNNFNYEIEKREIFIKEYSRKNINDKMANSIISYL